MSLASEQTIDKALSDLEQAIYEVEDKLYYPKTEDTAITAVQEEDRLERFITRVNIATSRIKDINSTLEKL